MNEQCGNNAQLVEATAAELAKLLNITDRRVQQLANDGVVARTARGVYDLYGSVAGYVRFLQKALQGSDAPSSDLNKARAREASLKGDLIELQLREKSGELVSVKAIEKEFGAMITAAKTELLTLPDKLSVEIKAIHGIDVDPALVEDRIYESLNHLARSDDGEPVGIDAPDSLALGAAAEALDDGMGEPISVSRA